MGCGTSKTVDPGPHGNGETNGVVSQDIPDVTVDPNEVSIESLGIDNYRSMDYDTAKGKVVNVIELLNATDDVGSVVTEKCIAFFRHFISDPPGTDDAMCADWVEQLHTGDIEMPFKSNFHQFWAQQGDIFQDLDFIPAGITTSNFSKWLELMIISTQSSFHVAGRLNDLGLLADTIKCVKSQAILLVTMTKRDYPSQLSLLNRLLILLYYCSQNEVPGIGDSFVEADGMNVIGPYIHAADPSIQCVALLTLLGYTGDDTSKITFEHDGDPDDVLKMNDESIKSIIELMEESVENPNQKLDGLASLGSSDFASAMAAMATNSQNLQAMIKRNAPKVLIQYFKEANGHDIGKTVTLKGLNQMYGVLTEDQKSMIANEVRSGGLMEKLGQFKVVEKAKHIVDEIGDKFKEFLPAGEEASPLSHHDAENQDHKTEVLNGIENQIQHHQNEEP